MLLLWRLQIELVPSHPGATWGLVIQSVVNGFRELLLYVLAIGASYGLLLQPVGR